MNPNWNESAEPTKGGAAPEPAMPASGEPSAAPTLVMHSHDKGVTVHVHHKNGKHEKHEHSHGDAEGMAAHVHEHFGGTSSAPEPAQEEKL